MFHQFGKKETKSAEMVAFGYWLRTGRRLTIDGAAVESEHKFNPYHDPRDGRFTFAPGGGILPPRVYRSRRDSSAPRTEPQGRGISTGRERSHRDTISTDAQPSEGRSENRARLVPAQYRPNPRAGMGGNGGPPLNDPLTLDRVFPGGATSPAATASPGGAITAMADNILDLTGPGARLTSGLAADHVNVLINQIRRIDPSFRYESLGFPQTLDGQVNLIRHLRVERALAFHRAKGELRPMQVEVLRHLQEQTDRAYDRGLKYFNEGRLRVRLSREEAIGNFIDREVRERLRELYNQYGITISQNGPFRIIGREYASSGTDRAYRIPDARIGNIAFDVSLTRKTLATQQVRGFFAADFRPDAVIIVRPSQLGRDSTYRINRPGI